ncbi:Dual specificity phosphatase [Mollivirus sibericum]|uniref:Dual specificity phosphatase n=1 Tax=Mollivirus sibericum TaxID=1678078 RepID=UPI0006B2EB18|nr:Dual specificity phosphatase [Mollivirus sibericum]ALD62307.1 Dual specificity phosphatase [Mollivirus sibericum]
MASHEHHHHQLDTKEPPKPLQYADRIERGLHLGSIHALTELSIQEDEFQSSWCVLTVLTNEELQGRTLPPATARHLIIRANDVDCEDLYNHFDLAHAFIADAHSRGMRVLVHCRGGVSRSATMVAAHLMMQHQMTWHEAIDKIRKSRRCVQPNPGFVTQLKALNTRLGLPSA